MRFVMPCFYAALACVSFGIIFELHNWKYLFSGALTGMAGWLVYLLMEDCRIVPRFFAATIVVAALAELLARIFKAPATIFLIVGIIPLVPGGGMYYTMEALINSDMQLFVRKGLETAASAGAMAVGCSLVSSMARIMTVWRRNRHSGPRSLS